jgi:hypothetical protein
MASSSEFIAIAATVAGLLTTLYAAYWAFAIRRALAVRLYRNQALGVGLVAVSVGIIGPYYTGLLLDGWPPESAFAIVMFFSFTLFYWTNASVGAARRLDPLLRDTFHWSRLRLLLLAPIIAAVIYDLADIAYHILRGQVVPSTATGVVGITFGLPIDISVIAAAVMLPVVGVRSRDPALRRQLVWFGLFAASLLAFVLVLSSLFTNNYQILIVQGLGIVVAGYCLYRSARSLVPLNRISKE